MRKVKKLYVAVILLIAVLEIGCKKETLSSENALTNEIQKITGSDQVLTRIPINNQQNKSYSLNDSLIVSVNPISIHDFKNLYQQISNSQIKKSSIIRDVNQDIQLGSDIKSTAIINKNEIDDGPKPAGYYHAKFSYRIGYYTGVNNLNLLGGNYDMYLDFNTDASGRITGTPSLTFVGTGFYSFTQINISSITFNPLTHTSTFTITGNYLIGIQGFGATLGYTSRANYYFRVNMEEDAEDDAVSVHQK